MTLRTRLLAGFTVIFLMVVAAGAVTVSSLRSRLYDQVDDRLLSTPLPPSTRTRAAPPAAEAPTGPARVDNESISDLYVAVLNPDGSIRPVIAGQLLTDVPDLQPLVDTLPKRTGFVTTDGVSGGSTFRALFLPGTASTLDAVVVVPVDDVEDAVRRLTYTLVAAAGLIGLALVLIASWVSRFGLRPISSMTEVAEAISSGRRDRRAEIDDDSTEAGRLGHAFNTMLDERDRSDARLRQFVSNASHELRTPLTSIRGYVDLYRAGGFRNPGELDDAMRRLNVEAERMHMLVEDLLLLATFDEEQSLEIAEVRLDEVVHDVVALASVAHPDREISVDAPHRVDGRVDRLRIHQALASLIENAVRHTPDECSIQVSAARSSEGVRLSVVDDGPGLSAEEAVTVFDRFSRGDASRARATGGSGLGLSITQAIVHAHGGSIAVASTPGGGATFTIVLPPDNTSVMLA